MRQPEAALTPESAPAHRDSGAPAAATGWTLQAVVKEFNTTYATFYGMAAADVSSAGAFTVDFRDAVNGIVGGGDLDLESHRREHLGRMYERLGYIATPPLRRACGLSYEPHVQW